MRAGIIVNPYAGRSRRIDALTERRAHLARAALASCGIEGEVAFTGRRGAARSLARSIAAAGATSLVCWGGDGTVNEVASEAVRHGLPLGIVPSGSGNGLARELGLDRRPEAALRTALRGPERILDAGEIDGRFFANVAGVGFDAHLARVAQTFARRGPWAYLAAGIPELLAYRPATYRIRTGTETFRTDALLVTIANGRQYGNGAVIAPRAQPDDGRLDLVCVPALSTAVLLRQAHRLFTGTVDRVRGVRTLSVGEAEVSGSGPLAFHVDGEACTGGSSLRVRVLPGVLRVRVPAADGGRSRPPAGADPRRSPAAGPPPLVSPGAGGAGSGGGARAQNRVRGQADRPEVLHDLERG